MLKFNWVNNLTKKRTSKVSITFRIGKEELEQTVLKIILGDYEFETDFSLDGKIKRNEVEKTLRINLHTKGAGALYVIWSDVADQSLDEEEYNERAKKIVTRLFPEL